MSRFFPSTAFGQCAHCSRQAADNGGTSADVSPTYTAKRGLNLVYFRGEWWHEICRDNKLNEEHDQIESHKHVREEQFRAAVGFTNTVV